MYGSKDCHRDPIEEMRGNELMFLYDLDISMLH